MSKLGHKYNKQGYCLDRKEHGNADVKKVINLLEYYYSNFSYFTFLSQLL